MSHLLTVDFRQETHKKTAGVKRDYNRLGNQKLYTVRLSVRTLPFHGSKRSSILLRCTILKRIYSTLVGKAPIGSIPKSVFQYGNLKFNTCFAWLNG